MRHLLVGLLLGTGVFCIWWSLWVPDADATPRVRRPGLADRLQDDLVQAGYDGMRPRTLLVACVIALTLVFAIVLAVTTVVPIAVCFAAMAGYAPIALVRMRARRRRAVMRDLWPDAVDNIASGVRAGLALPEALAQLALWRSASGSRCAQRASCASSWIPSESTLREKSAPS